MIKAAFIPDIHCPYQDKEAIKRAIKFVEEFKPDDVIFLGDLLDFYSLSRFMKLPELSFHLQKEIEDAVEILYRFKAACPDAKFYLLKGNHEFRLQKYLCEKAPELISLNEMKMERLLGLKEAGVEYVERGIMHYRGIVVKHGTVVRQFAGYAAKAEMEANWSSGVSGHTHRLADYNYTNESGQYKWIEAGCLCADMDYMEGKKPNWQRGMAIGYFDKKGAKLEKAEF